MRPAPPAVIALLASGDLFVFSECFTVWLKSGQVLRYTDAQQSVTYTPPGELVPHTYTSTGVVIGGLRTRSVKGVTVDEQECTISAEPDVLVDGQPLMVAIRLGFFDGGYVARDKVYQQDYDSPVLGAVRMFYGRVSTVDPGGDARTVLRVKSELVTLDTAMPRNFFQTGCTHVVFDAGCTLNKDDFAVEDTSGAASTRSVIEWASATAGDYDQGTITFETGPNIGVSRTIRQSTGGTLILAFPLQFDPSPGGDQFKCYPGCDRTRPRCTNFFNNLINFRSAMYTPPAETAL